MRWDSVGKLKAWPEVIAEEELPACLASQGEHSASTPAKRVMLALRNSQAMNVTFQLKGPLPHVRDHFALGATRAGTEDSGDLSNIRDGCCFWDGRGTLAKSRKVGKILETGVCHPDTRNVSVQINWSFVISTFQCLKSPKFIGSLSVSQDFVFGYYQRWLKCDCFQSHRPRERKPFSLPLTMCCFSVLFRT